MRTKTLTIKVLRFIEERLQRTIDGLVRSGGVDVASRYGITPGSFPAFVGAPFVSPGAGHALSTGFSPFPRDLGANPLLWPPGPHWADASWGPLAELAMQQHLVQVMAARRFDAGARGWPVL